jgi:hypothetical protein
MKITEPKEPKTKMLYEIAHGHLFYFKDSGFYAIKLGDKHLLLQSAKTYAKHPTGLYLWDHAEPKSTWQVVDCGLWDVEATDFVIDDSHCEGNTDSIGFI